MKDLTHTVRNEDALNGHQKDSSACINPVYSFVAANVDSFCSIVTYCYLQISLDNYIIIAKLHLLTLLNVAKLFCV